MIKPPKPADEASRLAALRAMDLLDTPPEERFDRFTRLAQRSFGVSIALVSLVDADRQWFKSRQGLEATETPREISFCGHAILEPQVMVVPDAHEDERFCDNPLVTGAPNIRFYAGCPIAAPDGSRIGTLCLIDEKPRTLDDEDLDLLRDLGGLVEDDLRNRALASIDELTGISNRRGFETLAARALSLCRRVERSASLLFIDLDRFKQINDQHGHAEGDKALCEMAGLLVESFRDSDVIGRMGGDEFCVLLAGATDLKSPSHRLRERLADLNATPGRRYALEASIGIVEFDPARHADLAALMAEADAQMYARKQESRGGETA